MPKSPSSRQIAYATSLRDGIRERLTRSIDRSVVLPSFDPGIEAVADILARSRTARAEGRTDDARALGAEANAVRHAMANTAIDAYLSRRDELAQAEVESMDSIEISAYIDEAKGAWL